MTPMVDADSLRCAREDSAACRALQYAANRVHVIAPDIAEELRDMAARGLAEATPIILRAAASRVKA